MKRFVCFRRENIIAIFFCVICLVFTMLTIGCGDGVQETFYFEFSGSETDDTGSGSFNIRWCDASILSGPEEHIAVRAIGDCEDDGIATVSCEVYDDADTFLVSGGPWPCSERQGRVHAIPVGRNRRFVILGVDADGNIVYQGMSGDIAITSGETTDVGTIDAHAFVSALSAPENGASVTSGSFFLEWEPVENAREYRILISDNDGFETPVIDERCAETTYTPTDLSTSVTYHWRVYALDAYGNQGGGSEIFRFTITGGNPFPPADDDTARTDEDTAVVINVLENDADTVGDNFSISRITQGDMGRVSVNSDGRSLTYIPNADANGLDRFTYTASDGTAMDEASVVVTINPVPDPPRAGDDSFDGIQVFSVNNELNVLENDSDPDAGDTLAITGADSNSAQGGTVAVNTDGDRLVYTPATGMYGEDTFRYTITDGQGNTATAGVRVSVVAGVARLSVDSHGQEVFDASDSASISVNGRFVAFRSCSDDLVDDDNNRMSDIFVYDRQRRIIERVSLSSDGGQGDDESYDPVISADGRFVAFRSYATNLVPEDTNGTCDIFIRDRHGAGITERVSVSTGGGQAVSYSFDPAISADGRFVAFKSHGTNLVTDDTNGVSDVFLRDRQEDGITERISVSTAGGQSNGYSFDPAISADGRFVAFTSYAANLVPNDNNQVWDVFIRDRQGTGYTERVSVASGGGEADDHSYEASISTDGRFVTFASFASNLTTGSDTDDRADHFIHDRDAGGRTVLAGDAGDYYTGDGEEAGEGAPFGPVISADGRFVVFESYAGDLVPGDTNDSWDVFATPNPFFGEMTSE